MIWWRRRYMIMTTVPANEKRSKTIDINPMNQGSCNIFCGCLRWWWSSAVPLGWARGGAIKWLGSIVNGTYKEKNSLNKIVLFGSFQSEANSNVMESRKWIMNILFNFGKFSSIIMYDDFNVYEWVHRIQWGSAVRWSRVYIPAVNMVQHRHVCKPRHVCCMLRRWSNYSASPTLLLRSVSFVPKLCSNCPPSPVYTELEWINI